MNAAACLLLTVPMVLAGKLTFGTAKTTWLEAAADGTLSITTPTCLDRSNFCAPYKNADCVIDRSATVVTNSAFNYAGNEAKVALYSDGTLRFASTKCIGVERSSPSASQIAASTSAGLPQLKLGELARIHMDASSKLFIQAPSLITNSMTIAPQGQWSASSWSAPTACPSACGYQTHSFSATRTVNCQVGGVNVASARCNIDATPATSNAVTCPARTCQYSTSGCSFSSSCPTACGNSRSLIHGSKSATCMSAGRPVADSLCFGVSKPQAYCRQECPATASCCSTSAGQPCHYPNEQMVPTLCLSSQTGSRVGGCNEPGRFRTCSGPISPWSINPISPAYAACNPHGGCQGYTNCWKRSTIGCDGTCDGVSGYIGAEPY